MKILAAFGDQRGELYYIWGSTRGGSGFWTFREGRSPLCPPLRPRMVAAYLQSLVLFMYCTTENCLCRRLSVGASLGGRDYPLYSHYTQSFAGKAATIELVQFSVYTTRCTCETVNYFFNTRPKPRTSHPRHACMYSREENIIKTFLSRSGSGSPCAHMGEHPHRRRGVSFSPPRGGSVFRVVE